MTPLELQGGQINPYLLTCLGSNHQICSAFSIIILFLREQESMCLKAPNSFSWFDFLSFLGNLSGMCHQKMKTWPTTLERVWPSSIKNMDTNQSKVVGGWATHQTYFSLAAPSSWAETTNSTKRRTIIFSIKFQIFVDHVCIVVYVFMTYKHLSYEE